MKTCRTCETEYPATVEFFVRDKASKDGLRLMCHFCSRQKSSAWQASPAGKAYRKSPKAKAAAAASRKKHGHRYRWKRRDINIPPGLYDALAEAQGNVCVICGGTNNGKRLAVDHDHATGIVRGLLCNLCNIAVGTLRENRATALCVVAYIANMQDIAPLMASALRIPTITIEENIQL